MSNSGSYLINIAMLKKKNGCVWGGDLEKNSQTKIWQFLPDPKEINRICSTVSSNQKVKIQHAAF